jgi:co-chaperonin GroES (HSP10)
MLSGCEQPLFLAAQSSPSGLEATEAAAGRGVRVGDTILFGTYSDHEITIDGEYSLAMREDDVLAIIDGK